MIEIRALSTESEFADAVDLQKRIWNFADIELLPVRLFVVATKVGGQSFGAFAGGRMVGFLLAIPGLKRGAEGYLHSHMLGVLPEYRDRGLGRMLKLKQREDALARAIELVEWTFDPLEIKNAFFNMERLGAIVRRYVENQYGTTSSPLHGGLPTDRCTAEWWVASDRVKSILAGNPADHSGVEERIEVPADIAQIRRTDPKCAREIQKGIAAQFHRHLDGGLAVIGFERTETAGVYLLGKLP
jgi:predicted GNAT superfamily acetyltransferase